MPATQNSIEVSNWTFEYSIESFINCILSLIQGIHFKGYITWDKEGKNGKIPYTTIDTIDYWHPRLCNCFCLIDPGFMPKSIDNIKNIAELNDALLFDSERVIFNPHADRSKNFRKIIDLHMTHPDKSYDLNYPKAFYTIEKFKSDNIISAFDTVRKICLRFRIEDLHTFYTKMVRVLHVPLIYIPINTEKEFYNTPTARYLTKFLPWVSDAAEIKPEDEDIKYIFDTYNFKVAFITDYFLDFLL
jgi:hypothetical protein